MTDRKKRARLKALKAEIKELSAERTGWLKSNVHWGMPWCTGGDNCQGPTCEGCSIAAWANDEVAALTAQIKALRDELVVPPAPVLSGELFAMVGDRWVLA